MPSFPTPVTLITQSLHEAEPGSAEAGLAAMAALLSALGGHGIATRFYLHSLVLEDRIVLNQALGRLQEALADVGLEARALEPR